MGSVARVKKRTSVVGGSARKDIQEAVKRQKRNRECLKIPLIGGLFRMCISGDLSVKKSESSMNLSGIFSSTNNLLSSVESNGNFSVDDSIRSMGSTRSFDALRSGSSSSEI